MTTRSEYSSLRQGLVGAWCPSLGATGLLLIDRSGLNNHGTLVNMAGQDNWQASGSGVALNLDGVNDFVSATPTRNRPMRSLSIWFRPTATISATSPGAVILQIQAGTNMSFYIGFGSVTLLLANEYITVVSTQNQYRTGVTDGGSLAAGAWQHLAVVETSNAHALFLNGVSRGVAVNEVRPGTPTFNSLRIGCLDGDGGGPRAFFSGQIDDTRIYDRVLTLSEIKLLASRRGIGLTPLPDRAAGLPRKFRVRVNGTHEQADAYTKVGGVWQLSEASVNDAGVWK